MYTRSAYCHKRCYFKIDFKLAMVIPEEYLNISMLETLYSNSVLINSYRILYSLLYNAKYQMHENSDIIFFI